MRGRPGHEGWFPIDREPLRGETLQCSVELGGAIPAPEFRFVDAAGGLVGRAVLRREEDGGAYYGRCLIPSTPFRVVVSGNDAQGKRFQRIESGLRTPR
jgi:hypothetical protein